MYNIMCNRDTSRESCIDGGLLPSGVIQLMQRKTGGPSASAPYTHQHCLDRTREACEANLASNPQNDEAWT